MKYYDFRRLFICVYTELIIHRTPNYTNDKYIIFSIPRVPTHLTITEFHNITLTRLNTIITRRFVKYNIIL